MEMGKLVEYIVKCLVDDDNSVAITTERDRDTINIIVNVAENDLGKVIGRNGKIAQSIRAIVKSASVNEKIKYNVIIKK